MKKLTREEMKNVFGGKAKAPGCAGSVGNGGSCWHNSDWTSYQCGLTQAQAIAHGGTWCTASCVSSCYANGEM